MRLCFWLQRDAKCYILAKLYYKVKDYDSAIKYVNRYMINHRITAPVQRFLGECYEASKQPSKALDAYKVNSITWCFSRVIVFFSRHLWNWMEDSGIWFWRCANSSVTLNYRLWVLWLHTGLIDSVDCFPNILLFLNWERDCCGHIPKRWKTPGSWKVWFYVIIYFF